MIHPILHCSGPDGSTILNATWPQDRYVFSIFGQTEGGETVDYYVLADCFQDAVDTVLDWHGEEGSDDSTVDGRQVDGEELDAVIAACNAHIAKL